MTITKLDAARRQLDAAIRLFFSGGDPLAVMTLAYNAIEVSSTLAKREEKTVWLDFAEMARHWDTTAADVRRVFHLPRNFAKHADWFPDAILEEPEEDVPEQLLIIAVGQLMELADATPEMWALLIWFYVNNEQFTPPDTLREVAAMHAPIRSLTRPERLSAGLRLIESIGETLRDLNTCR